MLQIHNVEWSFAHDTSGAVAPSSSGVYNRRVSGYGASHLLPNPRFAWTSDTRQPLSEISLDTLYRLQTKRI